MIHLRYGRLHSTARGNMYSRPKKTHIHFVGIGGIGMSGIATILHAQGYTVSGCDVDHEQLSVTKLKALGCQIYHGNNTTFCNDRSINVVVYSSIIKQDNPELIVARERGIPTVERAVMLAELMRTKYGIAITGAHGKTTTTSLISHILIEAGIDPTVVIGGHLTTLSSNARMGTGDFLVAEADESDRSFLHLYPALAVITNIDLEHLETYADIDDIKQTFLSFLGNLPFYGKAILCIDDPHIASLLPALKNIQTITYGLSENATVSAHTIVLGPTSSSFTLTTRTDTGSPVHTMITVNMPGKHNVLNALGACALALELAIPIKIIAHSLATFKGVDRRFTYRGSFLDTEIFDDYGHHPNEIMHTLRVAHHRKKNRLITVFQPHRFSRTFHLWDDFLSVFATSNIDCLVITDIFAASESPIANITAERFVTELKKCNPTLNIHYIPYTHDCKEIITLIKATIKPDDLLLLLGAGKINNIFSLLTQ